MPEYIGYGQQAGPFDKHFEFSDQQKKFFSDAEEKLDKPLYLVNCINKAQVEIKDMVKEHGDLPDDALMIYDYCSPFNVPQMQPEERERVAGPTAIKIRLDAHRWNYRFDRLVARGAPYLWHNIPNRNYPIAAWGNNEIFTSISLLNFGINQLKEMKLVDLFMDATNPELMAEREQKQIDEMILQASKEFESASQQQTSQIKERIEMHENELASAMANGIRASRSAQQEATKLEIAQKINDNESDRLGKQLRELQKNIHIDRLTYHMQTLTVNTKELYLYSPSGEERVLLGRMCIKFGINGSVVIENLTNPKASPPRPHPHVNSGGQPCWGQMQSQVMKLISNLELVGLVETIINYLENYNPDDDYGRFAPYWFDSMPIQKLQESGAYLSIEELAAIEAIKENAAAEVAAQTQAEVNAPETTTTV